ncbi:NAD(P)-binding protein [Byssothecium circinans]|uniref:NAD(P)-binding protein n=1 Tax=Byssothecium circinans TaxID=147558 RepID=A0A6A5TN87_9PLEO|nr:NAD(P)-binding protein [Byssothecium circinans]
MAARINTVLVIGGTAGIGEQFVRRFHSLGKKVIVTGRNETKLTELAKELNGLETRKFDIADSDDLPTHVTDVLTAFPKLDSVIINAGIQKSFNFFDPSSISAAEISREITTNLTAPALLIQLFAPHLLRLSLEGAKTTLFVTSSTLAYVPLGFYPTYSASKAGIHALTLAFRQQLSHAPEEARKNFNVVEIVPPYTDTGLDKEHREAVVAAQGGPDKAVPAMPLQDYVEKFFEAFEQTEADGSLKKEIGVGMGQVGVDTWRGSFGKIYEQWHMST